MTLSRMIRLMGVALIAVAAFPLYLSEAMPAIFWMMATAGLLMGMTIGSKTFSRNIESIFRILVTVTLLVIVITGFQKGDHLFNSINLVFLATITRGMRLKTSRHYFQIIGLSFLILVASAIVNLDISFAVAFLLYAMFLTWTLIYTHVSQQVESSTHHDIVAQKASKFVSGKFLLGSSFLGLVLLVFSLTVFFLFPRFTLGFFAPGKEGETVQGFSDAIDLGHFGTLKTSSKIVLRLEFLSGEKNPNILKSIFLRGVSFDHYNGNGWSKSESKSYPLLEYSRDGYLTIPDKLNLEITNDSEFEYNIYQEPLHNDTPVIFAAANPLGIKSHNRGSSQRKHKRTNFFIDDVKDLTHDQKENKPLDYTVRSALINHTTFNLDPVRKEYPPYLKERYTQLPLELDERISDLAKEYSDGAQNSYALALSIENALKKEYSYTTEGVGRPTDPISNFLFERKKGHCEYFATAMVLMMRTQGIPARPVNGFLGSQYNSYGDYYIVTEANAHTWVEVFFPEYGWTTFDPTPPSLSEFYFADAFTNLRLWLDSMKLQWYKWVVFYNLDRQILLYTGLWNSILPDSKNIDLGTRVSAREFKIKMRSTVRSMTNWKTATVMIATIGFIPGVQLLYRYYRKRKIPGRSRLARLALKLKELLIRKGFIVTPGLTLPGLLKQGEKIQFSAKDDLDLLVTLIEEGRWDPSATVHDEKIKNLYQAVSKSSALRQ